MGVSDTDVEDRGTFLVGSSHAACCIRLVYSSNSLMAALIHLMDEPPHPIVLNVGENLLKSNHS